MQPFFTPQSEQHLDRVLRSRPLLALDFDGTLAPLVDDPDQASAKPAITHLLEQIGRHLPIAVISGRSLADLIQRLDFKPQHLIGEHGAIQDGDSPFPIPTALHALRNTLATQLEQLTRLGIRCEDKPHSLSLHYRTAANPLQAHATLQQLLSGLDPALRIQSGKMVFNVVDRRAADKGMALRQLMARHHYQHAIYVGDDENDEAAFAALGQKDFSLRIGREKPDSHACFYLEGQNDVETFLAHLLRALHT